MSTAIQYKYSITYKTIHKLCTLTETFFRYSALGKITYLDKKEQKDFIKNSRFINFVSKRLKNMKEIFWTCYITSNFSGYLRRIKHESFLAPIKIGSIVVIVAVFVNIILVILLKKEVGVPSWILRFVFLFIGLGGISCNASLVTLKQTSFILRRIYSKVIKPPDDSHS